MAESAGDKKHEATPYRRQKAREQGQVARSQDLVASALLLATLSILKFNGPDMFGAFARVIASQFEYDGYWNTDHVATVDRFRGLLTEVSWALLPILSVAVLTAAVANLFQVGILFLPDKLSIDWSRISPMKGVQRIFALANVVKLLMGMLKILLVAVIGISAVWGRWSEILLSSEMTTDRIGGLMWDTSIGIAIRIAVVLMILAIIDYAYQWWQQEQNMMMSDFEIKEEFRQTQGDPNTLRRRRSAQQQMAMQGMRNKVQDGTVVVTNPTELAVVLKYEPGVTAVPVVLAKGQDAVAARIRKLALEYGIPIVERKPLAQALFHGVEVGKPVPVDHYAAVGEVLRYVYQLQGKKLPTASELAA